MEIRQSTGQWQYARIADIAGKYKNKNRPAETVIKEIEGINHGN